MAGKRPPVFGAVEVPPAACGNGHPWPEGKGGHCVVGWLPCHCVGVKLGEVKGGHRTYACLHCDSVIYRPPHRPGSEPTSITRGQAGGAQNGSQSATGLPEKR